MDPPVSTGRSLADAAAAGLPGTVRATGADASAPVIDVHAPATGELLLRVEDTPPEALQRNLAHVAEVSRADWAWLSGEDRARHLYTVADVLTDHLRPLAVTAALTTGRPLGAGLAADGPAARAAAFSCAGWADKLEVAGARPRPGGGVVAVVTTWRSSTADVLTAVLAGLATGCGVVLRPRPAAAASAERLLRVLVEAGLPDGLVQTVPGADVAADEALWNHEALVAVRADGSPEDLRGVGVALAARGTPLLARTDRPAVDVVLAGADLEAVTTHLLAAVAGGAHERPGGSRVLAVRPVAGALMALLDRRVGRLRAGDPLERATVVGPVPTPHLAAAAREAGTALATLPAGGWWVPPAVAAAGRHSPWPAPGPVLGVRTVRSAADVPAHLDGAGSVTVWGGELGVDVPARPDRRRDALELLRACRG